MRHEIELMRVCRWGATYIESFYRNKRFHFSFLKCNQFLNQKLGTKLVDDYFYKITLLLFSLKDWIYE